MDQHDRAADLVGHLSFGGFGDIVSDDMVGSVFFGNSVLVEVFDGVAVVEAHEWAGGSNKVGVEGFDDFGSDGVGETEINDFADLP